MGASTNRSLYLSEPLEKRQLLSISPIQPAAMPMPVPAGVVFFAPEIRFAAIAHFQNVGYVAAWDHSVTEPAVIASAPSVANSTTGAMIVVLDDNSATTSATAQTFPGAACWDSPANGPGGDSDREVLQTNLASLTNDNDIVDGTDAANTADASTGADASNTALAATAQSSTAAVSMGQVNVVRSAGTGGHAQPGLLHPSPNESRSGSTGSDSGSSDGSDESGSRSRSDDAAPISASSIVTETEVAPAGGAVTSSSNQTAIAASAYKGSSGLTQSVFSNINLVVKPLASVTFSVLPLAIAEMSAPTSAVVDPAGPSSAPQAFARAACKGAAAVLNAANAIIEAPVAPVRAALVNLFHVDAISTFSDAMGAFIDESAVRAVSRGPISHSRAWKVTAAAAAADLMLVGYWLAARRQADSDRQNSAQAQQDGPEGNSFPFCPNALLRR